MASLIKKKKGNRLYYYLVESARVDGQPRIVHQAYLGTAEKLAELVQQKSAPVPLSATLRDFGLPGALWLAAKQSGLWPLLESLWPAPRSGPGPAHYRSEEHTSELQSRLHLVCRLLLEKKKYTLSCYAMECKSTQFVYHLIADDSCML